MAKNITALKDSSRSVPFAQCKRAIPAKAMPLDIGIIHFVGIGGIGMSGIAEILHNLGYQVAGSDASDGPNIERLRAMGIAIYIGQRAENVENAAVVVKSTAVPMTNPEIIAAQERQIPVVRRSEMLAELTHLKATIAVAGSHGKTTTTSLVTRMLEAASLDPTVINGGIINAYGTNAHLGKGDWLVAEADESDGTFIRIPATVGVITNIDPEHLDYWGSYDNLKDGFRTFINNLPFYGFAVVCADDAEVQQLASSIHDRRVFSYGIESDQSDVRAVDIRHGADGSVFDVHLSDRLSGECTKIKDINLPVPGQHNILNALAAVAIARGMDISPDIIQSAFASFSGVKRRFSKTGEVGGITVIDDYGHHPTEITATLRTARSVVDSKGVGNVIAVVQPHRYSRLENLFKEFCGCFGDADIVLVADVYAAGENPVPGVGKNELIAALRSRDINVIALEDSSLLAQEIVKLANPEDLVVCMGAGDITKWANALPEQLDPLLT